VTAIGGQGREAFLLGAGFSCALSEAMPDTKALGRGVASRLTHAGHSTELLYGLYGGNFEAWLTQLAEGRPWVSEADNLRDRAMFLEASSLVADIIRMAQRQAGARASWLGRLVTFWHQNRSVVLTLNYDTLIEQAIDDLHLKDNGELVHYSTAYAIPVTSATMRRAGVLAQGFDIETLRLLKLHGSINWYYSGSDSPHGETVYEGGLTYGWDAEYVHVTGDRGLDLLVDKVPFVVPPTGTKSTFFNNETIRAQWSVANEFLRGCRLVVMGYSLPEADHLMRLFLDQSVDEITLVNSDPEIGTHFRRLLPRCQIIDEPWVTATNPIEEFVSALDVLPAE
jgi:hypothetical protein